MGTEDPAPGCPATPHTPDIGGSTPRIPRGRPEQEGEHSPELALAEQPDSDSSRPTPPGAALDKLDRGQVLAPHRDDLRVRSRLDLRPRSLRRARKPQNAQRLHPSIRPEGSGCVQRSVVDVCRAERSGVRTEAPWTKCGPLAQAARGQPDGLGRSKTSMPIGGGNRP